MSRYVGIMFKIKRYIPLQARLNIYHSFIQSHVNYCCLVWGFSVKSNIESLFTKQKKGLRAVIKGYINYRYRNGILPGHTKPYFNDFNILSIYNLIALNSLLMIHKIKAFPKSLPPSITEMFGHDFPIPGSTHETCQNWILEYDKDHIYRTSIFFNKGPLLSIIPSLADLTTPTGLLKIEAYKINVRAALLLMQHASDINEWQPENFIICNIPGLRRSPRLPKI